MGNNPTYSLDELNPGLIQPSELSGELSVSDANNQRTLNDDGSVTIKLGYPVTVQFRQQGNEREQTFHEMRIRRITGADLRMTLRHQKDEEKLLTLLFMSLTGLPEAAFNSLDAADIGLFQKETERFLEAFQDGTGKS